MSRNESRQPSTLRFWYARRLTKFVHSGTTFSTSADTGGCVRIARTTRISWQHLLRRWRATSRHQQRGHATLTLLVLLTLGLGEPLLCIIHCQLWLPLAFHSYFAAQHLHAHHHAQASTAAFSTNQPAVGVSGIAASTLPAPSDAPLCAIQARPGSGSVPFHVPPSPIHDVLPSLVALFVVALAIGWRVLAPPGDPPPRYLRPLLRPPIPIAV